MERKSRPRRWFLLALPALLGACASTVKSTWNRWTYRGGNWHYRTIVGHIKHLPLPPVPAQGRHHYRVGILPGGAIEVQVAIVPKPARPPNKGYVAS